MSVLDTLRHGLVVSCQPVTGGPLDQPAIVAAMARAALDGGAAGLRIEGLANLAAVRPVVRAPIIALVKHDLADSPVRITPFAAEARALAEGGAEVVAYDATDRRRPEPTGALVAAIHAAGALAMADCATLEDARRALAEGADIVGSTLSGYTEATETGDPGPDLALVAALKTLGAFVMAEGRYNAPGLAADAIRAGADAVTVGSALTRLEHATGWFAEAVRDARG